MFKIMGEIINYGKIVKRNYYPWTNLDRATVEHDFDFESFYDDLLNKLYEHNLFYNDYADADTEVFFTVKEDDDKPCFTDGEKSCYNPHTFKFLVYTKKHDNEKILYYLFKEHKIKEPNIVEEITLRSWKTPKMDLEPLKNCTNLTSFEINPSIDLIDIEYIPTKNIRILSFWSSRPFYSYIEHIQKMKKLKSLSLHVLDETAQIDLTPITTTNTKIEKLCISTNYKKVNIKTLYKLKNLEEIYLNALHDIDFHSLYKLEKLEQLYIRSNEEIDSTKLLPLFNKDVAVNINGKYQNPIRGPILNS